MLEVQQINTQKIRSVWIKTSQLKLQKLKILVSFCATQLVIFFDRRQDIQRGYNYLQL